MHDQLLLIYTGINVVVLVLYGIDKYRAVLQEWRVSERILLIAAFLGPIGAYLAMRIFRHKIRNPRFSILVPLFILLHVVLYVLVFSDF